jgi:hypothetical protein
MVGEYNRAMLKREWSVIYLAVRKWYLSAASQSDWAVTN